MAAGAALTLIFQNLIVELSGGQVWPYLIMLMGFIVAAMLFLMCFRVTSVGLWFLDRKPKKAGASPVRHLTFGFSVESGATEAHEASRRMQHRRTRREAIKATRQMRDKASMKDVP